MSCLSAHGHTSVESMVYQARTKILSNSTYFLMHISFLVVPGVPRNARAVESSARIENLCILLVTWDPPAGSDGSDIDHYMVYIPSRNIMIIESSTITVFRIPNCRDDDGILVAAVNRFGCEGLNSSEVVPNLLPNNIAQTTEGGSTITPTQSGSGSVSSKWCKMSTAFILTMSRVPCLY